MGFEGMMTLAVDACCTLDGFLEPRCKIKVNLVLRWRLGPPAVRLYLYLANPGLPLRSCSKVCERQSLTLHLWTLRFIQHLNALKQSRLP